MKNTEDISKIIGDNLKRIRTDHGLSLGQLAAMSGVSKVMLSQIEKGASNPSINTVWKIADAVEVPYTALLDQQVDGGTVIAREDVPVQLLDGGLGELRCYYHHTPERHFELFHMTLRPGESFTSQGHGERTDEYTFVLAGALTLTLDDGDHRLAAGDAIHFRSDKAHRYHNDGPDELGLMIINYYR